MLDLVTKISKISGKLSIKIVIVSYEPHFDLCPLLTAWWYDYIADIFDDPFTKVLANIDSHKVSLHKVKKGKVTTSYTQASADDDDGDTVVKGFEKQVVVTIGDTPPNPKKREGYVAKPSSRKKLKGNYHVIFSS